MVNEITRTMVDAALAATDFANGPTSRRWMAKALAAGLRQSIESQDRRIAETRAAALEEAAELATTCIDPAGRCKCSTAYEIAAAIRALIPEQKEG